MGWWVLVVLFVTLIKCQPEPSPSPSPSIAPPPPITCSDCVSNGDVTCLNPSTGLLSCQKFTSDCGVYFGSKGYYFDIYATNCSSGCYRNYDSDYCGGSCSSCYDTPASAYVIYDQKGICSDTSLGLSGYGNIVQVPIYCPTFYPLGCYFFSSGIQSAGGVTLTLSSQQQDEMCPEMCSEICTSNGYQNAVLSLNPNGGANYEKPLCTCFYNGTLPAQGNSYLPNCAEPYSPCPYVQQPISSTTAYNGYCGGFDYYLLYPTIPIPSRVTTYSKALTFDIVSNTTNTLSYEGCVPDSYLLPDMYGFANGRGIGRVNYYVGQPATNVDPFAYCQARCMGYSFFGIEQSPMDSRLFWCFCGMEYGTYNGHTVADSYCAAPCGGAYSNLKCGGKGYISVYRLDPTAINLPTLGVVTTTPQWNNDPTNNPLSALSSRETQTFSSGTNYTSWTVTLPSNYYVTSYPIISSNSNNYQLKFSLISSGTELDSTPTKAGSTITNKITVVFTGPTTLYNFRLFGTEVGTLGTVNVYVNNKMYSSGTTFTLNPSTATATNLVVRIEVVGSPPGYASQLDLIAPNFQFPLVINGIVPKYINSSTNYSGTLNVSLALADNSFGSFYQKLSLEGSLYRIGVPWNWYINLLIVVDLPPVSSDEQYSLPPVDSTGSESSSVTKLPLDNNLGSNGNSGSKVTPVSDYLNGKVTDQNGRNPGVMLTTTVLSLFPFLLALLILIN